jgi:hypothetical protein
MVEELSTSHAGSCVNSRDFGQKEDDTNFFNRQIFHQQADYVTGKEHSKSAPGCLKEGSPEGNSEPGEDSANSAESKY